MLASGCPNHHNGSRRYEASVEKGSCMGSYEGYCVKCREKREFEGEKKELPNGRFAAQGECPKCGTKITRMLGKSA